MASRLISRGGSVWLESGRRLWNLSCAFHILKRETAWSGTPAYEVFYGRHVSDTYKQGSTEYELVDGFLKGKVPIHALQED